MIGSFEIWGFDLSQRPRSIHQWCPSCERKKGGQERWSDFSKDAPPVNCSQDLQQVYPALEYMLSPRELREATKLLFLKLHPISGFNPTFCMSRSSFSHLHHFVKSLYMVFSSFLCVWKSRDLFEPLKMTQYLVPRQQRVCWNTI